jgi:hypothetical protein
VQDPISLGSSSIPGPEVAHSHSTGPPTHVPIQTVGVAVIWSFPHESLVPVHQQEPGPRGDHLVTEQAVGQVLSSWPVSALKHVQPMP